LNDQPRFGLPAVRRAAGLALLAVLAASCARRPPVLIPPPSGVEAVGGYGSASVKGQEAEVKGKFAFVFRKPGLGRVEAFDPLGRTAYFMIFTGGKAYLVVPQKKAYAEDLPEAMIDRFLGFRLTPDEIVEMLSGQWTPEEAGTAAGTGPPWVLTRDANGRVIRGERDVLVFEVAEYFPGAGVPRVIRFSRPGTSGRMKILSLKFNPAPRPAAFETGFVGKLARKSWDELQEILRDEP